MSKKSFIARKELERKQLEVFAQEFVIDGEPLIYTPRETVAKRRLPIHFFRRKQYEAFLKCIFGTHKKYVPVVVILRLFVSPERDANVSFQELRKEKTPAVGAWELCEYILAFLEMTYNVLIKSYKQIVKIDVEKFYSNKPRTILQFIKYSDFKKLQGPSTLQAYAKSFRENIRKRGVLHAFEQGYGEDKAMGVKVDGRKRKAKGPADCDISLSDPGSQDLENPAEKGSLPPNAPCAKAGRRQHRKVSQ